LSTFYPFYARAAIRRKHSNDAADVLGFSYGIGSYDYSNEYVGIIYGGGSPTYVASGPNTQLVDRIVGRGSGNAIDAYCTACTTAQQQAAILAQLSLLDTVTFFTGTYTMSDASGSQLAMGSGTLNGSPERSSRLPGDSY
jgi:hypothetical protein